MASPHFALVFDVQDEPDLDDLNAVAAAVQKQLSDDVAPFWGVTGTIAVFRELERVPADYWPVLISDDYKGASLGVHRNIDGRPFALIKYTDSYSLAVSHEVIEILVDPDGERLCVAQSPVEEQGLVKFLVEVCDPSEHSRYGYEIDGILVSDFYTQRYFDEHYQPGVRYSFTRAIKTPRQVLPGGYLSWQTDDGTWWQHRLFGDDPGIHELPGVGDGYDGLRLRIDYLTSHPELEQGLPKHNPRLRSAIKAAKAARTASEQRAQQLRSVIAGLQAAA